MQYINVRNLSNSHISGMYACIIFIIPAIPARQNQSLWKLLEYILQKKKKMDHPVRFLWSLVVETETYLFFLLGWVMANTVKSWNTITTTKSKTKVTKKQKEECAIVLRKRVNVLTLINKKIHWFLGVYLIQVTGMSVSSMLLCTLCYLCQIHTLL